MSLRSSEGFGLVEALVATMITSIGVVGVASLLAVGARMQMNTRDASNAENLAIARLERLRMLPTSSPERANGGSLVANLANYSQTIGFVTLRWQIQDGPVCGPVTWSGPVAVQECMRRVVIVAIPRNGQSHTARVEGMLWR